MFSIIFTCIEMICKMKWDDYENKRMILRHVISKGIRESLFYVYASLSRIGDFVLDCKQAFS
jgi:hypothetical protein